MASTQHSGYYSRELGTLETFFKKLADKHAPLNREHWIISFAIGLVFPPSVVDPAPYLVRAWQVLRRQHPALGATIRTAQLEAADAPERTAQLAVGPFDADAWARDAFTIHHDNDGQDAEALFSRLRPAATATCHWIPTSKQILLRSSHWRVDGVGMAMLGNAFLEALEDVLRLGLDAGFDAYTERHPPDDPPLGPALETVGRAPPAGTSLRQQADAGADALVQTFLQGLPSLGLPTRTGSEDAAPEATGRLSVRLDAAMTARVAAASRALGVSVTSAVHAAVVRVAARFLQHPAATAYAAFTPVDLRRVLVALGREREVAPLGLFHSGLPIAVRGLVSAEGDGSGSGGPRKSFEVVAQELHAVYAQDLANFWGGEETGQKNEGDGSISTGSSKLSLLELAEPYVNRTTALFNAPLPPGFPPIQNPDLSSFGKMERYLQREYAFGDGDDAASKVTVGDVWIGTEVSWRSAQFHVWSWKDELTLAACFNRAYYEEAFVKSTLDEVIQELLVGLGISQ